MVERHSSNFRVITTNFLGVRIFRKFTVASVKFAGIASVKFAGIFGRKKKYRNDLKFSDRYVCWAAVQTESRLLREEQSDQGLHCLHFRLQLLDALLYGKATLFKFKDNYSNFSECSNF